MEYIVVVIYKVTHWTSYQGTKLVYPLKILNIISTTTFMDEYSWIQASFLIKNETIYYIYIYIYL